MSLARPALHRLLAVIATILVFWALKATRPVVLPLTFALFFVTLFWPLYGWLASRTHRWLAVGVTFLALLATLGLFVGAMGYAVDQVADGADRYADEFEALQARAAGWLGSLPGGAEARSADAGGALVAAARRLLGDVWSVLGYLVLILALFVLALGELGDWKRKLRARFDDPIPTETLDTAEEVAAQVQRFLLVQSATSVVTGVLTWLLCWALGVDFAFLWGLVALLLNFIPTLGSIVAILPPTAFALLQYGFAWQALAVLVGLALIQLVLGSYVDPKLQGRYLELSALVVLVSIVFWGWLWGLAGAFIATPITAAAVLACRHIEGAEWVHRLLTRADDSDFHAAQEVPPRVASRSAGS